jgi:hypothetical protein
MSNFVYSLKIFAKPNAKTSSIVSFVDKCAHVRLGAPATEGQANEELLRFMAQDVLKIKKSQVSLQHGGKSKDKVLLLTGLDASTIENRIKSCCLNTD